MIGTKEKDGKTVPNCVPKKSSATSEMPYMLELGSDGDKMKGKAIVRNAMTGKEYSKEPIPIAKAKAQKRILEAAMKEKERM